MREDVLARWVCQPPAAPVYQHLRDAEKESASALLGERGRVLDVASEVNVTRSLDADEVVRVDFSAAASDRARDLLGDVVAEYHVVSPEAPWLPFDADAFDGGVSLGPYDWRFLDVGLLTSEARRITRADGRYVFSVPTPRSPYETGNRFELRYWTPDEARALLEPGWDLADYDLLYQYPFQVHAKLAMLPDAIQQVGVDRLPWFTERLNDRDDWENASYLVLAVQPTEYEGYCDAALAALFRPTGEDGFWADDHVVRALEYELGDDGHPTNWTVDDDVRWRYAPMALLGAMRWRVSALGSSRYDKRLRTQLDYFREAVDQRSSLHAMPSYGTGPLTAAFAMASDVFTDEAADYLDSARTLFAHDADRLDFSHAEDSLALYGWTYLAERREDDEGGTDVAESDVHEAIDRGMGAIVERQDPETTRFAFDNPTANRHQNQMYTLWGLSRAIEVTGRTGYLENVEAVLDSTIDERMRDDGAFLWETPDWRTELGWRLRQRLSGGDGRPPHWAFLYSCHQAFFVTAVSHYYAAGGEADYDAELGRAMRWVYGENARGENLVDCTGIGVPVRYLTTDGEMDVPDQQFKGAYEVGADVLALTQLVEYVDRRRSAEESACASGNGSDSVASEPSSHVVGADDEGPSKDSRRC
jgi:SAM-dependent methyltransferase